MFLKSLQSLLFFLLSTGFSLEKNFFFIGVFLALTMFFFSHKHCLKAALTVLTKRGLVETTYPYNKSVGRGLKIVELLSEQGALTDKQIAATLDYNLLTVQQLLSIYIEAGYIISNPDESYDLSIKIIDISRKFKQRCEVKDIAYNHLKYLSEKYNETATLGAIEDTHLTYIDKIDSMELLRFVPQSEQRITAHLTALGKSILAYLPEKDLLRYCHFASWKAYTLKSVDSKEKLLLRLDQIRRQGFAICDEEYSIGLRSIAVAILDSFNYPRFAIGLWGPTSRLTPETLREMKVDLIEASIEISKYYTVPSNNKSYRKIDTNFVPIPEPKKTASKRGFLERALGMFL